MTALTINISLLVYPNEAFISDLVSYGNFFFLFLFYIYVYLCVGHY